MSYAGTRIIVDADSHLMEWPDFLTAHADARWRDALPPIAGGRADLEVREARHADDERAALVALGDDLLRRGPKWHAALGAVDPHERRTALDLLGFRRQVVYSSLCAPLFGIADAGLRYAAYAAHNRAMAAWCSGDPRLAGVALCDLDDPVRACREIDHALGLGLKLVWIPARAPGGRSPGHVDHEPVWSRLAERGVPFVLHVGSGPLGIGDGWTDTGRPAPPRMNGTEILTSKDFLVVHHPAQRFLSTMLLDGVLERHPRLRGGAIEMGAGWVPDLLRRLDHALAIWQRTETELQAFRRTFTEQAVAQLRFTPYPFEDVGLLMRESDPRLYMFSSDYPHAEGGRDPLKRFDATLQGQAEVAIEGFYAGNADGWLPP